MKISNELNNDEIKYYQEQIYNYFENGYDFERFLKHYLLKIGLDEVERTQGSGDGGVDLKAIRKSIVDFSDVDFTHYHVQAKRYALTKKITPSQIRELKGTLRDGTKGIFITTSDFSDKAIIEASIDKSRPIILINGKNLVTSCIDNQIGFMYKPIFSKTQLDILIGNNNEITENNNYIEKLITTNDIRARIISIPSAIMKEFNEKNLTSVCVLINSTDEYTFSINKGRNFLAGVTNFFRKYNLLTDDGVFNKTLAKFYYDNVNEILKITI